MKAETFLKVLAVGTVTIPNGKIARVITCQQIQKGFEAIDQPREKYVFGATEWDDGTTTPAHPLFTSDTLGVGSQIPGRYERFETTSYVPKNSKDQKKVTGMTLVVLDNENPTLLALKACAKSGCQLVIDGELQDPYVKTGTAKVKTVVTSEPAKETAAA